MVHFSNGAKDILQMAAKLLACKIKQSKTSTQRLGLKVGSAMSLFLTHSLSSCFSVLTLMPCRRSDVMKFKVETLAPGQPLGRHMQPTACDYYSLRSTEAAARERYTWWADEQRPALPEQGVDQRGDAGGVHAVDVRQPGWAVLGSKGVKVSFWW